MTEPDPQNPPPPAPKVEFTADQHEAINAIVAGKVAEAQRKAARDKQAEIDAYLADEKAKQDREKLDEVERLRAELADAEAKATQADAAAQAITARSTATTAFLAAGGNPANVDYALRLIDADADLDAEIDALATSLPALFASDGPTPPPAPHAKPQPPRPPSGTGGGKSAKERAKERFKPRHMPPAA